jgi:hypothetical protein
MQRKRKMKKFVSFLVGFILLTMPAQAQDIRALKTNESFEEVARIDQLQQIRVSNPPVTQYTPKNLRKQQLLEFQGRNTQDGSMTYWSTNISDYDTKIVGSELLEDGYYITDITGKKFKTSDSLDPIKNSINEVVNNVSAIDTRVNKNTENIQKNKEQIEINSQQIQNNVTQIKRNRHDIQANTQNINNMRTTLDQHSHDIDYLNDRVSGLQQDIRAGLATVTALTSLHPNPRAEGIAELSFGIGTYKDQCAGAAGLFIHPTSWSMVQGGFAFGNRNNYAGYVGITLSMPRIKFKKRK